MEEKMFLITSMVQVWLKSKPGEAVVWESFCEAATSVATSIDCCKTSVQVTHGMVSDSSIILLEVLLAGPRDFSALNSNLYSLLHNVIPH
ncbi:hypothetical protein Trydic_g5325 [Trypoxylus dichotomus]